MGIFGEKSDKTAADLLAASNKDLIIDMLMSMTGYGEVVDIFNDISWRCAISSVNSRYLDIHVRLPRNLIRYESFLRKKCKSFLLRGKIEVFYSQLGSPHTNEALIDFSWLASFFNSMNEWFLNNNIVDDPFVRNELIMRAALLRPELMLSENTNENVFGDEQIKEFLSSLTVSAGKSLRESQVSEGRNLEKFFDSSINSLTSAITQIDSVLERSTEDLLQRMESRLETLFKNNAINLEKERLYQELALQLDKSDITEELVRLRSHLSLFQNEVFDSQDLRKGKKLDFILQEMHREVNTIGSKSQSVTISCSVIEAKSIIEQMREQVQNVV